MVQNSINIITVLLYIAKSRFRIKRVSDLEVQVDLTATQEEEPLSREQLQESEVVCYLVYWWCAAIDYNSLCCFQTQTSKVVCASVQTGTPEVADEEVQFNYLIPMSGVCACVI